MKTSKKFDTQDQWFDWIGHRITKHSGKPFKSKNTIGIPTCVVTNPNSCKQAFLMDDGSIVDCHQTKLYSITEDLLDRVEKSNRHLFGTNEYDKEKAHNLNICIGLVDIIIKNADSQNDWYAIKKEIEDKLTKE